MDSGIIGKIKMGYSVNYSISILAHCACFPLGNIRVKLLLSLFFGTEAGRLSVQGLTEPESNKCGHLISPDDNVRCGRINFVTFIHSKLWFFLWTIGRKFYCHRFQHILEIEILQWQENKLKAYVDRKIFTN